MYLYPKTLRKGNFLGNIDIAVRKPDVDAKPTESHTVYIENGEAFYATSVSPQNSNGRFKTEFSIGDADHVAIEFDVEWKLASKGLYRPVTLGEPWLMRVHAGQLLAQKGETLNPLLLDTGNITSLKAVRSWQNRIEIDKDHGIVVLYVKDGLPYYVNYSYQIQGYKEWSDPVLIPGFTNVTKLTGFRSNDFRLVVILEQDGIIHQLMSARNWAGMGIPGEKTMTGLDSIKVTLTPLTYHVAFDDNISKSQMSLSSIGFDYGTVLTVNKFNDAYNPDAFSIVLDLEETLFNIDVLDFRVKDGRNRSFRVNGFVYDKHKPRITLEMEDFNNARDNLTVSYTGEGATSNMKGIKYAPFSIGFTPTGLVPVDIPLPVVAVVTNVEG
jgi:hypothetical protein